MKTDEEKDAGDERFVGIVRHIKTGDHGRYAFVEPYPCYSDEFGEVENHWITISLEPKDGTVVWLEDDIPVGGQDIVFWDMRSKSGKPYAAKARFFRPGNSENPMKIVRYEELLKCMRQMKENRSSVNSEERG